MTYIRARGSLSSFGTAGEPPSGYDPTIFPSFAVSVEVVVLSVVDDILSVLLARRKNPPYANFWSLLSRFKTPDETLDEAAEKVLLERTGHTTPHRMQQLRSYGDPGRDQRTNVVSVSYLAMIARTAQVPGVGQGEIGWWPVEEAQAGPLEMAFDHRLIVRDAVESARADIERTGSISALVGPAFTTTRLERMFEQLNAANIDLHNPPKL